MKEEVQKTNTSDSWIIALFLFVSGLVIFEFFAGVNQPILEAHSFRQTQTALTSYFFTINDFSFFYETPIFGEPWSIPFELPIYQYLVAQISVYSGLPLTVIGRAVSLLFLFATCIPVYGILVKILGFGRSASFFTLSLIISTPFYVFWSTTFMIETVALFLTISFLYFSLKMILNNDWSYKNSIFCSLFLVMAGLQKVTTVFPVAILLLFLFIYLWVADKRVFNFNKKLIVALVLGVISIIVIYSWIQFTDYVKEANEIGQRLTSSNLSGWNYGKISQRISEKFWIDTIFNRHLLKVGIPYISIGILLWAMCSVKDRHMSNFFILLLLLFIGPMLIFTNLHIVHNYYQVSNVIYIIIAFGISTFIFVNNFFKKLYLIVPILSVVLASNFYIYYNGIGKKKNSIFDSSTSKIIAISEFIKSNTDNNSAILIYGNDWSSTLAFYSQRKSLTVPNWGNLPLDSLNHTEKYINPDLIKSIVNCPNKEKDELNKLIVKRFEVVSHTKIHKCDVYLINK